VSGNDWSLSGDDWLASRDNWSASRNNWSASRDNWSATCNNWSASRNNWSASCDDWSPSRDDWSPSRDDWLASCDDWSMSGGRWRSSDLFVNSDFHAGLCMCTTATLLATSTQCGTFLQITGPVRAVFQSGARNFNPTNVIFLVWIRPKVSNIFQTSFTISGNFPDRLVYDAMAVFLALVLHQAVARVAFPFPDTCLPIGITGDISDGLG